MSQKSSHVTTVTIVLLLRLILDALRKYLAIVKCKKLFEVIESLYIKDINNIVTSGCNNIVDVSFKIQCRQSNFHLL